MNKTITCTSVNYMKIDILVIIFFFSFFANAQTKITISGKLIDKETSTILVPFFLKIAATGFQNQTLRENSCTENKDFGTLFILKKRNNVFGSGGKK